jgi:putative membrane protein
MSIDTLANSLVLLNHDGSWGDSEYWWIGRLIMFLFFIVLIALFFWFMRRNAWGHHEPTPMERAQGILAERYARGEIDGEEYRERMSQLT